VAHPPTEARHFAFEGQRQSIVSTMRNRAAPLIILS
jgi:hypothetical protein